MCCGIKVYTNTANVEISCKITNTGEVAGDEVVQLYVNDVVSSTTTYEKNLRGFERIHLEPGESKIVRFKIVPDDLILVNREKKRVVEPGEFRVMLGSSYEDIRLSDSFYYKVDASEIKLNGNNVKGKMVNDSDLKDKVQ